MKRYDSYKPSGIEWIGEIPFHWECAPLKRFLSINNGADYKHIESESGYPVMGSGGCFTYATGYMYDGEALLLGRKGTVDCPLYINERFWCVDTMFYAIPKHGEYVKFMYYVAKMIPFGRYRTATAIPSMTQTDLGYNHIAIPPITEQRLIAGYLDNKCAEIDKSIVKQQRRIELLEELKHTSIAEAFNVPGTRRLKLRFVFEFRNGYTPSKANPEFWENGTIPWFRMEDIRTKGRILQDAIQHITPEAVKIAGLFEAGSFIIATTATIGEHALLIADSLANQRFTNLKIRKSLTSALDTMYVFYFLYVIDDWCKSTVNTTCFSQVDMAEFRNQSMPIPSLYEQKDIVKRLDKRCAEIDSMINREKKKIELMQELKQSIITEVVTGKRKVV